MSALAKPRRQPLNVSTVEVERDLVLISAKLGGMAAHQVANLRSVASGWIQLGDIEKFENAAARIRKIANRVRAGETLTLDQIRRA